MKKSMEKKHKVIFAIFTLIFLLSTGYVVNYCVRLEEAGRANAHMQEEARQDEEVVREEAPKEVPEEAPFVSKIDFATLQQENGDIYAWLEIPGTVIDYPILQHPTELDFYLHHTVEGVEGLPGSIYTEYRNNKDFEDFNTVIYGHNMRNGSMFAGLHQFEDSAFLQENPYLYIYLPDRDLKYQIIAAGEWDDHYILGHYGFFATEADREAFLTDIDAIRQDDSLEVATDSNILTLATCMGDQPHNRWLVIAVLVGVTT